MTRVNPAAAQYEELVRSLKAMRRVAVAFSGGLDSTFLMHAARQALGDDAVAVTLATAYMPAAELEDAKRYAKIMGARHLLLEAPFPEALRANPPERCYLCKQSLFSRLFDLAAGEGIAHVLDGTNLDDLGDHRPGLKALRELGVISPLLDAGLTKRAIRDLAKAHGLAVWDKPAGACLLTRIPHGVRVEEAELVRIEEAERFLKGLGFATVRLRSHGDLARIEVTPERLAALVGADARGEILARLSAMGYRHVTVDLGGYSMGSFNVNTA